MHRITLGMIGIGDILASHLAGLKANPDFKLVSVCRRSKDKLKKQAQQLDCKGFTDYHDLLAEAPDVVLVSLPHGLHCKVTIEALEAGCHVLVEKPMAVSVAECNRMLETSQKCGKHVLVTESASSNPGALLTGKKFKAGKLGRFFTGSILNARFYFHEKRPDWFLDPAMSGGGMFSNVGLHRLAIARACLPDLTPVSVSASVSHLPEYQVEACTSAIVKYKDGGSMLYEEVGYYPKPEWLNVGTHFIFEQGAVMWDDRVWRMITRTGKEVKEVLPQPVPGYSIVYANMVRAIHGKEYGPKAWEYAVDTAIAQAAYASSRESREIDLASPEWSVIRPDEG